VGRRARGIEWSVGRRTKQPRRPSGSSLEDRNRKRAVISPSRGAGGCAGNMFERNRSRTATELWDRDIPQGAARAWEGRGIAVGTPVGDVGRGLPTDPEHSGRRTITSSGSLRHAVAPAASRGGWRSAAMTSSIRPTHPSNNRSSRTGRRKPLARIPIQTTRSGRITNAATPASPDARAF